GAAGGGSVPGVALETTAGGGGAAALDGGEAVATGIAEQAIGETGVSSTDEGGGKSLSRFGGHGGVGKGDAADARSFGTGAENDGAARVRRAFDDGFSGSRAFEDERGMDDKGALPAEFSE